MKALLILCVFTLCGLVGGAVTLEEVESGGLAPFRHASVTSEVVCHPDGLHVLSSSRDQCVRLWEIKSGTLVRRFTAPSGGDMWGIRFLKGGKEFLAASSSGSVFRFEVATGKLLQKYAHPDDVFRLARHPDGKRFVSVGADNLATLWEIETGKKIRTFAGHTGDLYTAIIVAEGKELITGSSDKTVRKWDLESGECLKTLKEEKSFGDIFTLARSPDGRHFAMISEDQGVRVFECATLKEVWEVKLKKEGKVLAWSPDGKMVGATAGDGHLYLLDGQTGKEVRKIRVSGDNHTPITFTNDGTTLISGGDRILHLHEVATGKRIEPGMGFSDGNAGLSHFLVGARGKTSYAAYGSSLVVRDRDDESRNRSLQEKTTITAMALSRDGSLLAVGTQQGDIVVHDTSDLSVLCEISVRNRIEALDFHPGGEKLAAVGAKGMAGMWALPGGGKLEDFRGHLDDVVAVAFSSDGGQLLTAGDDRTVRQWSLADGRELFAARLRDPAPESLALLDEGRSLVVGADEPEVFGRILERLEKKEIEDVGRVKELLVLLGDQEFEKRENAMKELAAYGREVIPFLEDVETEDPEVRARLIGVRDLMHGRLSEGGLDEIGELEDALGGLAADPLGDFWVGRLGSEGASSLVVGGIDHEARTIKVFQTLENVHGPFRVTVSPRGTHVATVNADGSYTLYRVKRD